MPDPTVDLENHKVQEGKRSGYGVRSGLFTFTGFPNVLESREVFGVRAVYRCFALREVMGTAEY